MSAEPFPLCVDLDDTLALGDTVIAGMMQLLRKKPWLAPALVFQFLKGGRPAAKAWAAAINPLDASAIRYRTQLVDYLRAEKAKGRKIYLVSAASQNTADAVAAHLKLFDAAYGSSATHNLKGENKARFILQTIGADFVYAGDSLADCAVWKHARAAILCGKKAAAIRPFLNQAVEKVFDRDPRRARGGRAAP